MDKNNKTTSDNGLPNCGSHVKHETHLEDLYREKISNSIRLGFESLSNSLVECALILSSEEYAKSLLKEREDKKKEDPLVPLSLSPVILPEEKKYNPSTEKAYVMCSCNKECKLERSMYNSEYTCVMAKTVYGSALDCHFACLGLGDCTKICPQEAIVIKNMTAVVTSNCCGCGKCVLVC